MEDGKILLTVPQAADRLGIGRSFLYGLLMRGEVASVRLGRARRIPTQALDQYIANLLEEQSDS